MEELWAMVAALWVALRMFHHEPTLPDGHIVFLRCNFTILPHWLHYPLCRVDVLAIGGFGMIMF